MPFLYSVEREYETSIENLWNAWVDPKALEVWYSPTQLSVVPGSVENEAEVGGIWTVAEDAQDFENRVEAEHHDIVIEFKNLGSKSWVKFSQFGTLPEGQAAMAQAGMESYFDNLGVYLGR